MKIFICSISLLITSTLLLANPDKTTPLNNAFKEINNSLYELYAKRDFCNNAFEDFVERNNEAYEEWELQYSFFLRDFDTKYFAWKNGFNELQKQQLAVLEEVEKYIVSQKINKELSDGARDKCYTFKPALSRPRNNLELNHQDDINLIRLEANRNFPNSHNVTGTNALCSWQQNIASSISDKRKQGIEDKILKAELKTFKKSDDDFSKDEKKNRVRAYDDMIDEVYDFPGLDTDTFAIYRLAKCEFETREIDTIKLKKINDSLINCQRSSSADDLLLARCITKLLPEE